MAKKLQVRITRLDDPREYTKKLVIQILDKKYPKSSTLAPIGVITWHGDEQYGWYGMRFNIECELHDYNHLLSVHKVAKALRKVEAVGSSMTPAEVLLGLQAEEHFYVAGNFIPFSCNGQKVFEVIRNGEVWTRICAPDETVAARKAKALKLEGVIEVVPLIQELTLVPVNLVLEIKPQAKAA